MPFFDSIKQIFQPRDRWVRLSRQDPEAFAREFCSNRILFLRVPQTDGLNVNEFGKEQLLEEISKAAERSSLSSSIEIFLLTLTEGTFLPVFSSMKHVEIFWGEFSRMHKRVLPVSVLEADGKVLVPVLAPNVTLVINPLSPDEHHVGPVYVDHLKKLCACE